MSELQLPPPRSGARERKVLVALTAEEHAALARLSKSREEPVATTARTLITTALGAVRAE